MLKQWLERLTDEFGGALLLFCYEAGPCGYGLYRQLTEAGHACQQLNAFVLRHGHHWPRGKTRWTSAHCNWLESLRFEHDWQQIVLQEYIDAVKAASRRVADLTGQLMQALPGWSLAPVVDALVALRGIDKLAATVLLAELAGPFSPVRFFRQPCLST